MSIAQSHPAARHRLVGAGRRLAAGVFVVWREELLARPTYRFSFPLVFFHIDFSYRMPKWWLYKVVGYIQLFSSLVTLNFESWKMCE